MSVYVCKANGFYHDVLNVSGIVYG